MGISHNDEMANCRQIGMAAAPMEPQSSRRLDRDAMRADLELPRPAESVVAKADEKGLNQCLRLMLWAKTACTITPGILVLDPFQSVLNSGFKAPGVVKRSLCSALVVPSVPINRMGLFRDGSCSISIRSINDPQFKDQSMTASAGTTRSG